MVQAGHALPTAAACLTVVYNKLKKPFCNLFT